MVAQPLPVNFATSSGVSCPRLASLIMLAACAAPTHRPATDAQPAAARADTMIVVDGESLLRTMHARWSGQWFRTLAFRQHNTLYRASGGEDRSEWLEYASLPGKLRIDYVPLESRSGTLFTDGRVYSFQSGVLTRSEVRINALLLLAFDVYVQPPDTTARLVRQAGFKLDVIRKDRWDGRSVWVVGASEGDTTSAQFWVDGERLVVVRTIESRALRERRVVSEARLSAFQTHGGVPVATDILFLRDGRPVFRERYANVTVNPRLPADAWDPDRWAVARPDSSVLVASR